MDRSKDTTESFRTNSAGFFLENGKPNRSEYILLGEKYGNDGDMIYVSFEELIVFSENTLAI